MGKLLHLAVWRILVAISALLAIRSVFKHSILLLSIDDKRLQNIPRKPFENLYRYSYDQSKRVPLQDMAAAEFVEICLSAKHCRCGASSSQRPGMRSEEKRACRLI